MCKKREKNLRSNTKVRKESLKGHLYLFLYMYSRAIDDEYDIHLHENDSERRRLNGRKCKIKKRVTTHGFYYHS